MAILVFQHHPLEGPSRLGAILRDYGHRLHVCELHEGQPLPPDLDGIDGIVSLGGPMNVDDTAEHPWLAGEMDLIRQAHEREVPVVGLCLGAQLLTKALGGEITAMDQPEAGWQPIQLAFPGTIDPLFSGTPWRSWQFHLHSQEITALPAGATPLAGSKICRTQSFKVGLTSYGFQYHFEWTKADITSALEAHRDLFNAAEIKPEAVQTDTEQYYELYRHLGDRMCHNIANLLVPIDKRFGGRHGTVEPTPVANWQPAKS